MFASANSSISCLLLLRLSVRFRVGISVVIYTITIHYTLYRHLHNSFPVCHDICINQHNKLLAVTFNCFGENWTLFSGSQRRFNFETAVEHATGNSISFCKYVSTSRLFHNTGLFNKAASAKDIIYSTYCGHVTWKVQWNVPKKRISSFAEMYIWLRLHFAMGCKKQGSICEAVRSYCICHCLELPLWN